MKSFSSWVSIAIESMQYSLRGRNILNIKIWNLNFHQTCKCSCFQANPLACLCIQVDVRWRSNFFLWTKILLVLEMKKWDFKALLPSCLSNFLFPTPPKSPHQNSERFFFIIDMATKNSSFTPVSKLSTVHRTQPTS